MTLRCFFSGAQALAMVDMIRWPLWVINIYVSAYLCKMHYATKDI